MLKLQTMHLWKTHIVVINASRAKAAKQRVVDRH